MKKIIKTMIVLLMITLFIPNVMADSIEGCRSILPKLAIDEKIANLTHTIILVIQIVAPVVLIIFGMIDLVKGLMSQKDDEIKKGQQTFIKRLIAGAIVFFIISIVKLIISFVSDDSKNMWSCVDCFLNGADKCGVTDNTSTSQNGGNTGSDSQTSTGGNAGSNNETPNQDVVANSNLTYTDGEIIYFDVVTGKGCVNYSKQNSKTGYNGLQATKTSNGQTSCLKFYLFNYDGGDEVNLLLDHNTTAVVIWNSNEGINDGPKEILEKLYNDTANWNGTNVPKNYTFNNTYTIDYSGKNYKARLITANEIAKIVGKDVQNEYGDPAWNETVETSDGYDICEENVENCQYAWLYDATDKYKKRGYDKSPLDEGETLGYWTSSAVVNKLESIWSVMSSDSKSETPMVDAVVMGNHFLLGVRPVIQVSKTNLQ